MWLEGGSRHEDDGVGIRHRAGGALEAIVWPSPRNMELVLLYEEEGGYIIKALASTLSTVVNVCSVLNTGGGLI